MRIAVIAESFLPQVNGVTNSILRVLEHAESAGHEAMVVAPDTPAGMPSAPTSHGSFPVLRVPSVMVPKVSSLPVGMPSPGMTAALRSFGPDVVHLASPFSLGAGGLAAARRLDVPAVAVYQTDVAGFAESYGLGLTARACWAWTRRIHKGSARTLAPSTSAMDALAAHGIPRVHRWGRGVDTVRFVPSARSAELRERWTGGADSLVVGFVGRLAPEKHVERLAVLDGMPGVTVVVVGDGPERARLERAMPSAVFLGQLGGDDLARAYASFDVFAHPGEHETFCQTVQEALSSGVPVIGPDAGGPRDLVSHCRNGYLLPVERYEELLPSAMRALADPTTRARFAAAARKSVLHRTWPVLCNQLIGHYEDVIGTSAVSRRTTAA
ncbi:alpha-mannosyltransferase [Rhodococcus sp. Leaf7]|uniref:glycosyltransferase family 4 protein n=1 Tax=unclassified Rhodococcus (in: high G+C Gram-positive bacteria) TaxID=192944 RepID=UPI0007023AF7|nr:MULTISPECIES: glycosyltransferase family 1 protein [unclassified Rhodococcus (in: high G+C Gram-positive bacteria)]KQU04753.1 alpha-mannosyltransferase [Rhodococcus sp. Leaf7]KQU40940.1 alpha-mannosyltransferase [Rhodococcus sp. Leaf247]